MTENTDSTHEMRAKWDEAFNRLRQAEAVYQEVRAACQPLYDLEAAFEARHGLVAPGVDRNGTPGYYEKRAALFEKHPHYKAPEALADMLERLTVAFCDIQTELMRLPAPDLSALRWKIEHTAGDSWEEGYIAQMRADIDRLMGPAPSLEPTGGAEMEAAA